MVFAVSLCCIFAFAGNSESPELPSEAADSAEADASAEILSGDASSQELSEESVISSPKTESGYGVYLDGWFVAAVSDKAVAESAINRVLQSKIADLKLDASAKHSISNSVDYESDKYSIEKFVDSSALIGLIEGNVKDYSGEPLPVKLNVSSEVTSVKNVVIEYETKTIYTDSLVNGAIKTVSDGFNGEGKETSVVTYLNGVKQDTKTSVEVITAAIDEVLEVGTRAGSFTIASSIDFKWPYEGFIYSYYGESDGRVQTHKGIDLVNYGGCYRDPAYAAADGVVVFSGDNGNGYGNYVIIDHGNGILTYYAHFDSCSVSTGDIVKAGDEVGKIGSTGRSTGNHLHFEIKIDGVSVDPLLFLD